ncbi:hypothetical protein [Quatrionicoccus australiensis]|uniref:hypothetical protein n=1 Tax=Quatrionicoccus australiensis TaxID=138118 RepID=UPI001CF950FA|nr:hypothetical protein [Quatrionicoccus australiensis]MCB4358445.1 hypothetical protein [Quatrionicoccus australiensis]
MSFGLTDKALLICHEHYNDFRPKTNGCGKCPIHKECTSPVGAGQAALDDWRKKVNQAAENVEL